MNNFDLHADDYGISPNNSLRILELVKSGHLNSFSIIPNMSRYDECMNILKAQWDLLPTKPMISVHINLIGGQPLTSDFTPFNSWGEIFIKNFSIGSKRKKYKTIIKEEIKSQITRVYDDITKLGISALRLDSHIHVHMIPIVFDAMMEAVHDLGLSKQLKFVRISKEPLWIFLSTKGVVGTYPMINIIKNLILRILSISASHKLDCKNIPHHYLWGLIMSGNMDQNRVQILLPKIRKLIQKNHTTIELLAHPGKVLPSEMNAEYGADDKKAFIDINRDTEYEMFLSID